MLPSFSTPVQAAEIETTEAIEQPNVSKDIGGEESKEIPKGEDYNYNVSVELPESVSGYESIEILDDLDTHLAVQGTAVLIDEEENDTYTVGVDGQKISLGLTMEELEELAGKEVKLQITTQVKEDAATADKIENVAQIVINDDLVMETNPAVVTPVDADTSEEQVPPVDADTSEEQVPPVDADTSEEQVPLVDADTSEEQVPPVDADTSEEQVPPVDADTSEEQVPPVDVDMSEEQKINVEDQKENPKNESVENKAQAKAAASIQPQNAAGFTMNDVDFYDYAAGWIIQYEGDPELIKNNNGKTWEKGRVKTSLSGGNGLAKNKDAFYVDNGTDLYKINVNGNTTKIGSLWKPTAAAGMSNDGNKYVYVYKWDDGNVWISSFDVNTKTTLDKKVTNVSGNKNFTHNPNGDLVVDGEGYVWHATYTATSSYLVRIDPNTGELDKIIPVKYKDGSPLKTLGELAFLKNGTMAGLDGRANPYDIVLINPLTGLVESTIGTTNDSSSDFASSAFPILKPILSIKKSVDPEGEVQPGDELTYTLEVSNTGNMASTETIVKDALPAGTSYVAGTTKLNGKSVNDVDGKSPVFNGMKVNSPDTDAGVVFGGKENVAVVTFKVKVDDEFSPGTEIVNLATVNGDGVEEIPSNEVKTPIKYKDPVLKSEKSATIKEKGEGNTDKDNPEVGDTLLYTIKTQNTIKYSVVKNLVISDEIPEGLEYVAGSLKADGKSVTDEKDDDNGYAVDGKLSGQFGDIKDMDWHTLTFEVKVKAGQAGQDIKNIATVDGDNIDKPDEPKEEVKIYPRGPKLESEKSATNAEKGKETFEVGDTIIYTIKTRNKVSDSLVSNLMIEDTLPAGLELIADSLKASHDGTVKENNGVITAEFGEVKDTEWRTVTFEAKIKSGQSGKDIKNTAKVTVDEIEEPEEPTTTVKVDPKDPKLQSEKSGKLEAKTDGNTDKDNPEVGDTLLYTIKTKNTIEDSLVKNLVISDKIPEGLEYVAGSLQVDGVSVTDAKDDDNGHAVDGEIAGQFGDIEDTEWHTLEFLVKVKEGQAGADIKNIATVKGENIDKPDEPEEEVKIYPREPKLESEKSATNAEKGKKTFEVGDTIVYTIKTRNKESDSLVSNLTIEDTLPAGLELIADSLKASHGGTVEENNGVITAKFGEVTDTEWRTVTFEAKIKSGQSGKDIKNTAKVTVDEIEEPEEPTTTVKVDPKEPKLESKKSSKLEKKAEGNTDAKNPEVGDTIRYTITTKNTIEDSLVENLVITDTIPSGLSYVAGSLEVDGEKVTDAKDDDAGHVVDGKVTGSFGNVTDTKDHTVTFLVTVDKGQSGKDIKNIAIVGGENTGDPDEPEEEVKIYPREPKLDSKKSSKLEKKAEGNTDAKNPEVGDTIRYTITTKNTIEDSLVENLVITDTIPSGLSYVAGSLEVDGKQVTDAKDDDAGHVVDGKVTGSFGNVTDTKEHTVTFLVTVDKGQSGKDIKNIAIVGGENTGDPDEPEEEVKIYPREPKLESKKSSKLEKKAEGNTDAKNPEVGDTIRYTITTKNTIEDSLVKNLVITDTIPAGLSYVAGSLEVDGKQVTDAKDDDSGHVVDGKVTGNFGDVTDTKDHTVTFLVTVDKGQSGKDIKNIAVVGGENIEDPDEPEEEVKIYPREPKLDSKKSSKLEKKAAGNTDAKNPEVGDTIRYTITTKNTIEDSLVENLVITDTIPGGLTYVAGSLEVDGKQVTDAKDDDAGHVVDGKVTGNFGDVTDTKEHTVTFLVTVDKGQSGKTIKNIAVVGGDNGDPDEPEEEVNIYPREPKLDSKKSSKLEKKAAGNKDAKNPEVGDTIRYTITTKNTIEDSLVKNLVITDTIPTGLTYVAGSLEVDGKSVTDAKDDDAGHVVDGKVTGTFGDVTDTKEHTVTFLVTVDKGQSGKTIKNIAVVGGDNGDPDEPEEEVNIYPREPKLDSKKSSKLEKKAAGNTDAKNPEVGDTIRYTITTKNTIEDSLVENLVITDTIPAGLSYVAGSLEVDGEKVTDAKDDDAGHVVDGKVTGNFGDVTDTKEHTVTFLVTVDKGQSGKTIKNIAVVGGDNGDPDEPEEEVNIYPREPKLDSKKSSKLEKKAAGNKDAKNPEVGDTIRYTVTTKNTIEDSLVKNLVISDTIPSGLSYVAGSLEVDGEQVTDAKDDDAGHVVDGKVTGNFGDVTDTKEHTVTFLVTVDKGQSGKTIKNIAVVGGDNGDPDEPEEEVNIYPREPKLDSKKSSKLEKKAAGNKDAKNPEVGDTIRYTITTKNTIEDSLVENLVITDTIPGGLTYVAGSLEVDGKQVTDAKDDDAGHVVDGKVTGNFGDVTDTKDHTVTFLVTVDKGQSGKDIKNIAVVGGENTGDPDEPEEEVKIYPREPKLESEKSATNAEKGKEKFEVGDTIVYTIKTRNKVSDSLVQNLTITDKLPAGLEYVADSLKVSHEGAGEFKDGAITANFGDVKDTEWRTVTFQAKIKSGQSSKELKNIAVVDGDNIDKPDEPEEEVTVDPKDPTLQSEKSAKLEAKADGNKDKDNPEVGDTLLYTIKTKNKIADSLVKNLVISDEIPEGLEYVAGSLKVDGQSVTDAKDDDKGYAVDGKIVGQFGNIKDTNWHTVEFLVKVKSGQSGKDIKNIATVDGDNIDKPDKPEEEVQIYPRHSVLESEKSASNLEKGKETFEVGDTVVYTIKARNTVSDSLVENLKITDKLPAGLEYVDGSLEVSHESTGEFKDGTIIANFGDVKDTEWRTVTFKAKIQSDQFGKSIKNIAEVSGDNVPDPNHPEVKIEVEPKDPEPTPVEPKDPAPKPEPESKPNPDPGVDNSGGKTPPPKTEKEEGKKLPNTATNIFNYGLLGVIIVLAGLLGLRRRKSSRD